MENSDTLREIMFKAAEAAAEIQIEYFEKDFEIGRKKDYSDLVTEVDKKCEAKIIADLPNCIGEGRRIRDERHGPTSWISITLTEGKFRQVRKMTAAVGFPTLRLVRIRVGNIHLQNLKAGEVLEVTDFQITE